MIRKLNITENVVSDMYGLGIINMDEVRRTLQNYSFDINLNQCSLVPIDKPRTYAAAKKSDFPILGVKDNCSIYQGWNKPRKVGLAVMGIYGKDNFFHIHGEDKVRYNFESCDKFYKIVPDNADEYKSRSSISRNREHTVDVKLDDTGKVADKYYYNDDVRNTLHKKRAFTTADLLSYDPTANRKRYVDILTKNHLDRFVSDYNDACSLTKAFQNRLNNIDITSVSGYDYNYALDAFKNVISRLKSLNHDIENIKNGTRWEQPTESEIDKDIDEFDSAALDLDKKIKYLEK